ncbi:hypothetical protein FLJC2902T_31940 [Flavobacterium limnosediminis JC2902]|uniref:Uncharacterized protein n=1 Tax=Flavobacterium limnosediminis JC2902 TaxID=1341181 RepID=V6SEK3_9FLAO|nr:hypothetical protein FLJC2902T_31940 [Flavobacterium limnosediminis JC2902]
MTEWFGSKFPQLHEAGGTLTASLKNIAQRMKTDNSIKEITIASINRKVMNPESWIYSKVCLENKSEEFTLEENELPIFEINSSKAKTIITTRHIIEKENENICFVSFDEIDDVIYGDFKKQINKPELSKFRIVDIFGEQYDFQMETGKASIGLINSINTVLKLKASR